MSGDPRESLGNRRRVGRVGRSRVAGARSARMRATSGKSLFTETLYVAQIIRYVIFNPGAKSAGSWFLITGYWFLGSEAAVSSHSRFPGRLTQDSRGLPWIPWNSMEFHGINGIPWNPWNSMDSMEFHGIHGIPDTVLYKESKRGKKKCSFAKHHDLLVFFSVFK